MRRGSVFLLLIFLVLVPTVSADDGPSQDEVNAVARRLFCPVCENTPLDVCPTEACQQWRDVIRTKLVEGQSEQEILDYFAMMYGDSVLAEPPPRQLAAWLLPAVIFVAAVAAFVIWLRSSMRPVPVAPMAASEDQAQTVLESDPYIERLEKELAEWES